MSDDEKYVMQGRARARLKELESTVATMTAELSEFAGGLLDMSGAIRHFIADPGKRETGKPLMPLAENLRLQLLKLDNERAAFHLQELFRLAGEARILREQIEKF